MDCRVYDPCYSKDPCHSDNNSLDFFNDNVIMIKVMLVFGWLNGLIEKCWIWFAETPSVLLQQTSLF